MTDDDRVTSVFPVARAVVNLDGFPVGSSRAIDPSDPYTAALLEADPPLLVLTGEYVGVEGDADAATTDDS